MSFTVSTTYTVITCYKCHLPFAVPDEVNQDWLDEGSTFYCPNGHDQHYMKSTVSEGSVAARAHSVGYSALDFRELTLHRSPT